jgi:hypothetical protein
MASDPNSSFSHDNAPSLHKYFVFTSRHSADVDIWSRIFNPSFLRSGTTVDYTTNFKNESAPDASFTAFQ